MSSVESLGNALWNYIRSISSCITVSFSLVYTGNNLGIYILLSPHLDKRREKNTKIT